MEYKISNRLRLTAIILMVVGAIGVSYSFYTSHVTFEEVENMLANESHHGGSNGHGETENHQADETSSHDTHAAVDAHGEDKHAVGNSHEVVDEHTKHVNHVMHAMHNRPWSAFYIAAFFFMMISLGVLAFYAIQYASQAGWSPLLLRVMEGITAYLFPGALILLAIAVASGTIGHYNIFVWMDPDVVAHDKLIQGKTGWLNIWGFAIRGLIFIGGWSLYRYFSRKFSIAQDKADDNKNFKKTFRISAAFLVFFIYTESMMSWDWIMSVDPHWFSTLFGWYVFAGMIVCAVTTIAFIAL